MNTTQMQLGPVDAGAWDDACARRGHTGWADSLVYAYDQPIRLRAVARAIDRLYPGGLSGRAVLDIGCGTGDFVGLARARGAAVTGVDVSPAVLARARQRFAGDAGVRLVCSAVEDLDAAADSFDLITSITVLQHVTGDGALREALARLRAALKPGGRMLLLELAPARHGGVGGQRRVIERSDAEWRAALAAAGFRVAAEASYPQLGLALLRGFARAIDTLRGDTAPTVGTAAGPPDGGARPGLAKRGLRGALLAARAALLAAAAPWDRVLGAPYPRARRYYRLYVLVPA